MCGAEALWAEWVQSLKGVERVDFPGFRPSIVVDYPHPWGSMIKIKKMYDPAATYMQI